MVGVVHEATFVHLSNGTYDHVKLQKVATTTIARLPDTTVEPLEIPEVGRSALSTSAVCRL